MSSRVTTFLLRYLPFSFLVGLTGALPLFFITGTRDAFTPAKQLLLIGMVSTALLTWILRVIVQKGYVRRKTIMDVPILLATIGIFCASLFSLERTTSFLFFPTGESISGSVLIAILVGSWLLMQELQSTTRWHVMLAVWWGSAMLASLYTLFTHSVIGTTQTWQALFPISAETFSIVSNSFQQTSLFFALIACSALGFVLHKHERFGLDALAWGTLGLSLFVLIRIGFQPAFLFVGAAAVLFTIFGWVQAHRMRLFSVGFSLFLAIVSLAIALWGVPADAKIALEKEVLLGTTVSWQVAADSLQHSVKQFLFGSGPGTFLSVFQQFRPVAFVQSDVLVSFAPSVSRSFFATLITEAGFLGALGMAAIIAVIFLSAGSVSKTLYKQFATPHKRRQHTGHVVELDGLSFVIMALLATIMPLFFPLNVVLLWTWAWAFAMGIVGVSLLVPSLATYEKKHIALTHHQQLFITFIFVCVLVLWGTTSWVFSKQYTAEKHFTAALAAGSHVENSQAAMRNALDYAPASLEYRIALAESHFERARMLTQESTQDPDAIMQELIQATNHAKQATVDHPVSPLAWETLATMYLNTRTFAPDSNEWALQALDTAITLMPNHPRLYWQRGSAHEFAKQDIEAIEDYQKAIEYRPHYQAAYISLAELYEKRAHIEKAFKTYERLAVADSRSTNIALFHQGRLLFNRNQGDDITRAKSLWEAVVQQDPHFVDAWYSLGILAEQLGDKTLARDSYKKVEELIPGNPDIEEKLRLLGR